MWPRWRENEAPIAVPAPAGNPPSPSLKPFQLLMTNGKPDQLWYGYTPSSTFDRWGGDVSAEFFCRSAASNAAREPADASSALWLCADTIEISPPAAARRATDELSTSKHLSTAPTSNEDAPHVARRKSESVSLFLLATQTVTELSGSAGGGLAVRSAPADVRKPTSVCVGKQSDAGTRYCAEGQPVRSLQLTSNCDVSDEPATCAG